MTASDHATKPFRNTLRERGHPYMVLGASGVGTALLMMRWRAGALRRYAAPRGDENIDCMVTRGWLERRERRTRRAGLDGLGAQSAANLLSGMRCPVRFTPQHLLANALGSIRSRNAGRHQCPPRALEVSKPGVRSAHLHRARSKSCSAVRAPNRPPGGNRPAARP